MKIKTDNLLPSARREGLVKQELSNETLVYDLSRHQAHCLNEAASQIWDLCDGRTTVPDITAQLSKDRQAAVEEKMVWLALDQLSRAHLLQESLSADRSQSRYSRRQVMQSLGLGAAIAIPMIVSIIAPTAAQAATIISPSQCNAGIGVGKCCNNGKICLPAGSGCAGAPC